MSTTPTSRAGSLMENLGGISNFGSTHRTPLSERYEAECGLLNERAKITDDHWALVNRKGSFHSKDDEIVKIARPSKNGPKMDKWPDEVNVSIRVGALKKELRNKSGTEKLLQQLGEERVAVAEDDNQISYTLDESSERALRKLRQNIFQYDGTDKEEKAARVLAYLKERTKRKDGKGKKDRLPIQRVKFVRQAGATTDSTPQWHVIAFTEKDKKQGTMVGAIDRYPKEFKDPEPFFGEAGGEDSTEYFHGYRTLKEIKAAITDHLVGKVEVLPTNESGDDFAGWIAMYNGKKLEITKDQATSLYGAKQFAIKQLRVPKSKQDLLAVEPAYHESAPEAVLTRIDFKGEQLAGFSLAGDYIEAHEGTELIIADGAVVGVDNGDERFFGENVTVAEVFDAASLNERSSGALFKVEDVSVAQMREMEVSGEWERERGATLNRVGMTGDDLVYYRINRVQLNAQPGRFNKDSYVTHVVRSGKDIVGVVTNMGMLYTTKGNKPVNVVQVTNEAALGGDDAMQELTNWLETVADDIPGIVADLNRGKVNRDCANLVGAMLRTRDEDWYTALFR